MNNIKRLRTERGWSQAELSRHTPTMHPSSISLIESGRMQPGPGQLRQIAGALGWTGAPESLLEDVSSDAPHA